MSPGNGPGDPGPTAPGDASTPAALAFGRFELHPARHQLLRDGEPVELQPKVFEFIAYLAANADRVVDKNELLDAVWPRQVVTEAALSRCAMKARRALDDDAENPAAILTVHGRGFRFVAPVRPLADRRRSAAGTATPADGDVPAGIPPAPGGGAPPMAEAGLPRAAPWPGSRRFWWLAGLAGLALALAGGAWWQHRDDQALRAGVVRVAVLPIEVDTGEARDDWARLGLMEALTENLSGRAATVSTEAVYALEQALSDLPPEERLARLREAHGATHLVQGRLGRGGGQLRLDYTVTGPDGRARPRSLVAADVPSLVRGVGADLVASLGRPGKPPPVAADSFANEATLRGMALRLQGDMAGALRYFELAVEQAPQAFWPRLQAARARHELGETGPAREQLEALLAEADAGGDPATRLAVRSALSVLMWRSGDNTRARPLLAEALALAQDLGDPDREAAVHSRLGILETYAGDYEAAHRHLLAAIEAGRRAGLQRASPELRHSQAQLALREGDLAGAATHFEAALAGFRLVGNQRNEAIALNGLANLRRREGRFEEALALAEQALAVHQALGNRGGEASALIGLAVAEAQLGRLEAASERARQSLAIATELGQLPNAALAASLLGQFGIDLGRYEEARGHLQWAQARLAEAEDRDGALRQRLWLARLARAEGEPRQAAAEARALLHDLDAGGADSIRLDTLRFLAELALEGGDPAAARERLQQALAVADGMDDARRRAQLQARMAEAWLASGEVANAAEALALSAPVLGEDPLQLRIEAELLAAQGDPAGALAREQAYQAAMGQRLQPADRARLQAREAAAAKD